MLNRSKEHRHLFLISQQKDSNIWNTLPKKNCFLKKYFQNSSRPPSSEFGVRVRGWQSFYLSHPQNMHLMQNMQNCGITLIIGKNATWDQQNAFYDLMSIIQWGSEHMTFKLRIFKDRYSNRKNLGIKNCDLNAGLNTDWFSNGIQIRYHLTIRHDSTIQMCTGWVRN